MLKVRNILIFSKNKMYLKPKFKNLVLNTKRMISKKKELQETTMLFNEVYFIISDVSKLTLFIFKTHE